MYFGYRSVTRILWQVWLKTISADAQKYKARRIRPIKGEIEVRLKRSFVAERFDSVQPRGAQCRVKAADRTANKSDK